MLSPGSVTAKWEVGGDFDMDFQQPGGCGEIIVLEIEIEGPESTKEGENSGDEFFGEPFTVTVGPASVDVESYLWSWSAPAGAGNNPNVNFLTPAQEETSVNPAHWFALPDSRLYADTGGECVYTINCTVTVAGQQFCDPTPFKWTVYVPDTRAVTHRPQIEGTPAISVRVVGGQNEWYVSGVGPLTRTAPHIIYYISTTSQFYNKVKVLPQNSVGFDVRLPLFRPS